MSNTRKTEGFKLNRQVDSIFYAVGAGLAGVLYVIYYILSGSQDTILLEAGLVVSVVPIPAIYYNWQKLGLEQQEYLLDLKEYFQEELRTLVRRMLSGPITVYQYCTGSYLGAAIGAVPFGIAGTFAMMYYANKGHIPSSSWQAITFAGTFTGVVIGPLYHSEKRLHLRWFWVPVNTIGMFFIVALFSEGLLRAASYVYAAAAYGDGMAHWWDVRVRIDWWAVWLKLGIAAVTGIATFTNEVRKTSGTEGPIAWSLKTARNGLLTIGMVGGEGWRALGELVNAALAGGAWWLAWRFNLACYRLDIEHWHIAATVAITLAAVPYIAFKGGLALEHLMRAGAAIMPPADTRPPITPRETGTGTPKDADAAGGPRKGPSIDDLVF